MYYKSANIDITKAVRPGLSLLFFLLGTDDFPRPLVLTALVISPVSYVAPAREISILIGAVMGTRLLKEGSAPRRLVAASAMVLYVVALAVG